jgi:hypothetical protein
MLKDLNLGRADRQARRCHQENDQKNFKSAFKHIFPIRGKNSLPPSNAIRIFPRVA